MSLIKWIDRNWRDVISAWFTPLSPCWLLSYKDLNHKKWAQGKNLTPIVYGNTTISRLLKW
ncbi:hypothetical protein ACSLBF_04890 [Pseudoalteromonas sp. T1lg65]|uniref:hypothetical protein n=1 Tax=Pseudoalteromonas sp. T1lg65 TaxID=2077101 RepID=UPI003F798DFE